MVATIFLIKTSNLNEMLFNQFLLKKWTEFFLFLALVASTRSSKTDDKEGAILTDVETLKVCVNFLERTILFFKTA